MNSVAACAIARARRAWFPAAVALCLGACDVPPPPGPPAPAATTAVASAPDGAERSSASLLGGLGLEQELEDVTFRRLRGTVTQWELHAVRVRQQADQPAHLEEVTLRYYGDEVLPTVVTADEADYEPKEQNATLRGNVHIAAPNGDTLDSTVLQWDGAQQKMRTDGRVTLRRGGSHITATGLETSPGLQDVKLFQVHGVLQDAELAG